MEKEQNSQTDKNTDDQTKSNDNLDNNEKNLEKSISEEKKDQEVTLEDKILELEDKLTRSFAEMENQRRRFEKEKNDAFEYGGFTFAKESLNLFDNFDRAKQSLEGDEKN